MSDFSGVVNQKCDVLVGPNWEGQNVVEMRFIYSPNPKMVSGTTVVIDTATAAKLIRQLQEGLEYLFNQSINERYGVGDE
jgi:hypothetical protein